MEQVAPSPDEIPVMVLARLAVSRTHQCRGIARAMVQDALIRTLAAADLAGIHAIVVHAIDGRAAGLHEGLGFTRMPGAPLVLYTTIPPIQDISQHDRLELADILAGGCQHETDNEMVRKLLSYARLNIEQAQDLLPDDGQGKPPVVRGAEPSYLDGHNVESNA